MTSKSVTEKQGYLLAGLKLLDAKNRRLRLMDCRIESPTHLPAPGRLPRKRAKVTIPTFFVGIVKELDLHLMAAAIRGPDLYLRSHPETFLKFLRRNPFPAFISCLKE